MSPINKPIQILCGVSGSGKSVRIANLMCKVLADGKRFIALDHGRNYQGLVHAVAGAVTDAKSYSFRPEVKAQLIEFEGSPSFDGAELAKARTDFIFIDEAYRVLPQIGAQLPDCLEAWLSAGSQVYIAVQSMSDLHGIPEELLAKTQVITVTRK